MEWFEQAVNIMKENDLLMTLFKGIAVILITSLIILIGERIILGYFKSNLHRRKNVNKIKTLERILLNIYKTVILFIGVAIFLDSVLAVDTTSILTVAGVSGLAVGFASQTIIKDFLTGIMLLMEDTITIGDIVEMNGFKGEIEDISLRSICLRDDKDVLHVIPNNIIRNFSNYSRKKQTTQRDVT